MMKHIARLALAVTAAASLALAGCSSDEAESGEASSGSLEFYFQMTSGSASLTTMEELISKFEEQTGYEVELTTDSANFEDNMKVRMASGDLPDVWTTHGWSVMRYSSYLESLDDQSWAQYVDPGLDESMRDDEGSIYALPITYAVTGILVNFDVLEEAGVNPDDIATWDDFTDALAKVTAIGKSGIYAGGKDGATTGDVADYIASGVFTDEELESFTNGTFESDAYQSEVLDRIASWADAGYFNADYVSASADDVALALAQGDAAFAFGGTSTLSTALTYVSDANVGFIPLPSNDTNDQYLIGGESMAYGVWKGSDNKEAALEFLEFLAEPENAELLAESASEYAGLTNVDVDLGAIQSSFDKWVTPGELSTKPYFDRVYLPDGMWSTMVTTTDAVITKQSTAAEATQQMADQFAALFGQES